MVLPAVRGVYDYQAAGEDEIDVKEGCMIQLTAGPRGGRNYGDGWWEGRCFIVLSASSGEIPLDAGGFPSAQYPRISCGSLVPPVVQMFIYRGSRKGKFMGPRQASPRLAGFGTFTVSPSSSAYWIPSSGPYCHTCFSCRRTLTFRIGINERGKKGIFPSNYVC